MTERPSPPNEAPSGYVWVPVPEDGRWQPLRVTVAPGVPGLRCRLMTARHQCGKPAVARLNRSTSGTPNWWAYCAEHMFGRWVEDGAVMGWRLRSEGQED